jgi:hypothetical protein
MDDSDRDRFCVKFETDNLLVMHDSTCQRLVSCHIFITEITLRFELIQTALEHNSIDFTQASGDEVNYNTIISYTN